MASINQSFIKHINSTASIEAEQSRLKADLIKNEKSRCAIKEQLDILIDAAILANNDKAENESTDSSIDSSTATTVIQGDVSLESIQAIDVSDDEEYLSDDNSNRQDDDARLKRFIELACKGKISDTVLGELQVLNAKLEDNNKVSNDLQNRWSELETTIKSLRKELSIMIQYIKIENLLFHNFDLPYGYRNMTSLEFSIYMAEQINHYLPQLACPLSWEHISTAHRLKTKNKSSNVIIVRFCNRNMKDEILSKKHLLKKRNAFITEHLTEDNLKIYKKAKELFGYKSVHTVNCKVIVNINGHDKLVSSCDDVNELFKAENAVNSNDTNTLLAGSKSTSNNSSNNTKDLSQQRSSVQVSNKQSNTVGTITNVTYRPPAHKHSHKHAGAVNSRNAYNNYSRNSHRTFYNNNYAEHHFSYQDRRRPSGYSVHNRHYS